MLGEPAGRGSCDNYGFCVKHSESEDEKEKEAEARGGEIAIIVVAIVIVIAVIVFGIKKAYDYKVNPGVSHSEAIYSRVY